jgi:phosphoribosylformylglycinamidine (FGAM) synthase-like enzyme
LHANIQCFRKCSNHKGHRSDGGVITTLLEMAFASHCGLDIVNDDISALFNEEKCVPTLE